MRGAQHGTRVRAEDHQQGQMQRKGKLQLGTAGDSQSRFFEVLQTLSSLCLQEHMIQNEVAILRRVKHPNIVLLIEEVDTYSELYLVMELVKVCCHVFFNVPM